MTKTYTYKQLQSELEAILETLESPELDIDEAAKVFERGIQVLELLKKHLAEAENKIIRVNPKN